MSYKQFPIVNLLAKEGVICLIGESRCGDIKPPVAALRYVSRIQAQLQCLYSVSRERGRSCHNVLKDLLLFDRYLKDLYTFKASLANSLKNILPFCVYSICAGVCISVVRLQTLCCSLVLQPCVTPSLLVSVGY